MSLESWKEEFEGKKIVIWGFAREGKASLTWIRKVCPDLPVTIAEGRKTDLDAIMASYPNVTAVYDDTLDFAQFDMVLKSPGIVVPQGMAKDNITGETQLFLKHYAKQTIGITGTKGKSTTTSLIYAMLKEGKKVNLVGNIGIPCFEAIEGMEEGELAVFELSCHQLEFCPYSPHVAIYLNLFEEHLDHYGTFENYGNAKANIFLHQTEDDIVVMHESLSQYIPLCHSTPVLIGKDIVADGQTLLIPDHTLTIKDCSLIGSHNYLNLAVAYYVANLYGISNVQVKEAVKKFQPLHHRLEDLGEFHDIRFVNDSICTIGQASIQALNALKDVDTILIGGNDRGIGYEDLEADLWQRENLNVIFMYASGKRIYEEMKAVNHIKDMFYVVEDLKEAVQLAKQITKPHHTVLLSPAASSYDHFKNFEHRGDVFAQLAAENQ